MTTKKLHVSPIAYLFGEVVFDITCHTLAACQQTNLIPANSRDFAQFCVQTATLFQTINQKTDWDEKNYLEEVEKFAAEHWETFKPEDGWQPYHEEPPAPAVKATILPYDASLEATHETIDENTFIDRFQPEQMKNGAYYRQRNHRNEADRLEIKRAMAEQRLWTAIDDDNGAFCIVSGSHVVNHQFYVITAKPYVKDCVVTSDDEPTPEDSDDAETN